MKIFTQPLTKTIIASLILLLPKLTLALELDGIWSVSLQGGNLGYGGTLDYWEIRTTGNILSIAVINPLIPGAPGMGTMGSRPLNVHNVRINGRTIYFTTEDYNSSTTTEYILTFTSPNQATGLYKLTNTTGREIGMVGPIGIITEAGKVFMKRQQ